MDGSDHHRIKGRPTFRREKRRRIVIPENHIEWGLYDDEHDARHHVQSATHQPRWL